MVALATGMRVTWRQLDGSHRVGTIIGTTPFDDWRVRFDDSHREHHFSPHYAESCLHPVVSADMDHMITGLRAAGWRAMTAYIWKSPTGKLHLGPAGAFRTMQGVQSVLGERDNQSGRSPLIARAVALRADIHQYFAESAAARMPDPDHDGKLRRIADGLDRMLASESNREL